MKKVFRYTLITLFTLLLFGCSIFPKQLTLKDNTPRDFTIEDKKYNLAVIATAYTSRRGETDCTPYLAAWNNRLKPSVKSIAVSRDLLDIGLTNGTKVTIDGLPGTYKVLDKMNKRWRKKIDIYMGTNLKQARYWGKRKVTVRWTKKSIEPLKDKKKKFYMYKGTVK